MLDEPTLEWLTTCVLDAITEGEAVESAALLFLLRRYVATDRRDLGDALGSALATALSRPANRTVEDRAGWLTLFAETSALSNDERIVAAAADLVSDLRSEWSRTNQVDEVSYAVDVCLTAEGDYMTPELVSAAIDELERVVSAAYRPGEGVAHAVDKPNGERGRLSDQVRAASALLSAFARSGRLPYSMLAEELMRFARRALWDDEAGGFFERDATTSVSTGAADRTKPFILNCEAARVLCRLDALHRDPEYQKVAVVVDASNYARDAQHTLMSQAADLRRRGSGAAMYGIALSEWLNRSC
jgi:uncharacterized protein YyaL (SSP411 family)